MFARPLYFLMVLDKEVTTAEPFEQMMVEGLVPDLASAASIDRLGA